MCFVLSIADNTNIPHIRRNREYSNLVYYAARVANRTKTGDAWVFWYSPRRGADQAFPVIHTEQRLPAAVPQDQNAHCAPTVWGCKQRERPCITLSQSAAVPSCETCLPSPTSAAAPRRDRVRAQARHGTHAAGSGTGAGARGGVALPGLIQLSFPPRNILRFQPVSPVKTEPD